MKGKTMYIAVDFDGTIVSHEFPKIGKDINAFYWLKEFQKEGVELILWTMRTDNQDDHRMVLSDAIEYCHVNGVDFKYVNEHPVTWTKSPKVYANIYIDDAAFGCPLVYPRDGSRPYVNWDIVGPLILYRDIPLYQKNEIPWISVSDALPPRDTFVETKEDDGVNVNFLNYISCIEPDHIEWMVETPTHWRFIHPREQCQRD